MIPTVGRIVHYTSLGDAEGKFPPEQQAAIITAVKRTIASVKDTEEGQYTVSLHIFYKNGGFDMDAPFSPKYRRGHWTWPPRT